MSASRRALAGALLLGLALRLGAYAFVGSSRSVADEVEYAAQSSALAEGRLALGEGKRPPGCIWYYAGFQKLTGLHGPAVRFANVLAGTVLVGLVWLLALRVAGPRAAAWAAFGCAAYPTLALYDVSFWSESLYACLMVGALVLLAGDVRGRAAFGAGLLMGGAALTREVGMVLPLAGAAALLAAPGPPRGRLARTLLLAAGFAVVVGPWSVRQTRAAGSPTLISRTGWLNLYIGNAPPPEGMEDVRRGGGTQLPSAYDALGSTRAERDAEARKVVLQAVRDRMPAWPFEKIAETLPELLTPGSLPYARLRHRPAERGWPSRWAYVTPVDGTRAEWLRDALAWAVVVAWVGVALAGTAGLGLAWGRPGTRLLVLTALLHLVPVVIAFAASRFRMPLVPLLLLGGAWLVVHGAEAWRSAGRGRRAGVATAVAVVALLIALEWGEVLDPRWN